MRDSYSSDRSPPRGSATKAEPHAPASRSAGHAQERETRHAGREQGPDGASIADPQLRRQVVAGLRARPAARRAPALAARAHGRLGGCRRAALRRDCAYLHAQAAGGHVREPQPCATERAAGDAATACEHVHAVAGRRPRARAQLSASARPARVTFSRRGRSASSSRPRSARRRSRAGPGSARPCSQGLAQPLGAQLAAHLRLRQTSTFGLCSIPRLSV
jgi:hypothetical protein